MTRIRPDTRIKRTAPVLLAGLLAACTVGPDFERPKVSGERGEWLADAKTGPVDLEPWRALGDPVLVELIETAVAANLDLQQAQARLREARAGREAAAGKRLPEAGIGARVSQRRLSENGQVPVSRFPGLARDFSLWEGAFDASWELDLWGGNRRAVEAATARLAMAEAGQREVQLRVIAEVTRAYAQLRGAQTENALLQAEASAQRDRAELVRQLREAGEVSQGREADAAILARQAEAALPEVNARIRASAAILAVLTGRPPEALAELVETPRSVPDTPDEVAAGLRSDVLRRRPDILVAEAELAAATADVGVETAKLFPSLSLGGQIGIEDRSGNDLFSSKSQFHSVGPVLSWPIFAGGRIRAQVRAASARADAAAAAYERAVLEALADSETAINRHAAAVRVLRSLDAALAESRKSLGHAEERYRRGEDSRLDLLQAQVQHKQVQRGHIAARVEALQAHAALVKALGGGWQNAQTVPGLSCASDEAANCGVADKAG